MPPVRRATPAYLALCVLVTTALVIAVVRGFSPVIIGALLVLALTAPLLHRWLDRHGRLDLVQSIAIGSVYLVLASTLVFRARTAEELAANPLDGAGMFRVACLTAALGVAVTAIALTLQRSGPRPTRVALLLAGYTATVAMGVLFAVNPKLVAFRAGELVTFLLVFVACDRAFDGDLRVPVRHVLGVVFILLCGALIGSVVFSDQAWVEQWEGQGTFRLHGVYPRNSSDYLGILSTIAIAFALGGRRIRWAPLLLGATVVLLAQHRTGLVAIGLVLVVRLLYERRAEGKVLALVVVAGVLAVAASGVLSDAWARGNPEAVGTLSARTEWWAAGVETGARSPILGLGISSGTRFEVFSGIGQDVTPDLHSTWVEVLVGTGLVGTVLLVGAYACSVADAHRVARRDHDLFPVLLFLGVGVNSLTHTTFELASLNFLLLVLVGSMTGRSWRRGRTWADEPDVDSVTDADAPVSRSPLAASH